MLFRMVGLLFLLLVLLMIGGLVENGASVTGPPGPLSRLSIYLGENVAETADTPVLPELKVRSYDIPRERLFLAVADAIKGLSGWMIDRVDREDAVLQATVVSPLWRFKDDVTVMISLGENSGYEVYVYSASRLGRGDLGANRRHILDLYEALETQLGRI